MQTATVKLLVVDTPETHYVWSVKGAVTLTLTTDDPIEVVNLEALADKLGGDFHLDACEGTCVASAAEVEEIKSIIVECGGEFSYGKSSVRRGRW